VTVFGGLLVAAGKPRFVLRAATWSLVANAVISVPLLYTIGFLGPAIGTTIAFIPTVYFYCHYIAKASDVPISFTFPVWGFVRVILVALPACAAAVAIKLWAPWDYRLIFLINTVVILGGYALVGTVVGLLRREDWRFASNWVWLRVMK
jgi:O-antigen/teichoic acid export membrane protein